MASVHQRYRILEKIDAGGMAEIYRAAATSIEGFERAVAIKRILPSLTQNEKFLGMFLDEARLSMQLTHANIVQILDIGKVEETFFIAMELIDGWNLRRIMQRSVDVLRPLPVPVACYMAMEIAKALAYAHEKTDASGQSLGIVHRDVSPPNVLVSKQGEVKLTDFGLARAASNVQVSETDVVKGKFAYLSPEVVDGKPADPRADIYSVGIILWEMLCGRKLFAGKTDLETVDLVRKGEIPKPSTLRPDADDDLDRIVLRVLARNPKRRYQTAREFEQELADYLFKHNLRATSSDCATCLRDLMNAEIDTEFFDVLAVLRAEMEEQARVGHLDLTRGQAPLRPEDLRARSVSKVGVEVLLQRLADLPLDELAGEGSLFQRLEGTLPPPVVKKTNWLKPAVVVAAIIVLILLGLVLKK
jgi:serine/threonine protein kinase